MAEWEEKLDRIIKQRSCLSFMSNSKWRRFFTLLAQPELQLSQGIWKLVDSENTFRFPFPEPTEIDGGYFLEPAGASPFKRIEWVEIADKVIPFGWENIPTKHKIQDTSKVLEQLNKEGHFEIEKTSTGLRVYGYR